MQTFLLIGQSNMAGRGPLDQVEPLIDERIRMFRGGAWQVASEPLHDDKPELAGIGLATSFARELLAAGVDEEIGLIPCAVGGTALARWQPGADLYERAVEIARAACAADASVRLAGMLWHQGEADCHAEDRARTYGQRLTAMIEGLRIALAAPACPVICGELGRFLHLREKDRWVDTVVEQTRAALVGVQPAAFVESHDLVDKGDTLHFDAVSLRTFGERYAAAYLSLVGARLGARLSGGAA